MRTNPFYDTWLFLIGATPDHASSGVGLLLVLVFWALLIAATVIAWKSWQEDPGQRTGRHVAIWAMRVLLGAMWFQGSLWKLPLPVSDGLRFWTEEMGKYAAFGWHRSLVENLFLPGLVVINPLVYLTELTLAVSFMLGLLVRPVAIVGMLFVLHIWLGLYHHPSEWPWSYIFLVFVQGCFVLDNAGKSLGLDALIARAPPAPFAGEGVIARLYRRLA